MPGVSDSGGGMGAATPGRAFEPFFSHQAVGQGSGLGLPAGSASGRERGGGVAGEGRTGQSGRRRTRCSPACQ
jgi:C4-dicarboxylate-specific signal transduction histidine kinase